MDIQQYLEDSQINSGRELIKPKHKEFVEQLKRLTMFLPEDAPATFRLRCLHEGVKEVPICGHEECSNVVTIKSSLTKGLWYETFEFSGYCCRIHARTSKKTKEKKKETFRERYGVDSYMDSDEFREKSKKSMIETHGVMYALQSNQFKEAAKNTSILKYGTEHPMQSDKVKDIYRESMIFAYGVEYPLQSETLMERMRSTSIERYGVDAPIKRHIPVTSINILESKELLSDLYDTNDTRTIGEMLGVHHTTVINYLNSHGIELKNSWVSYNEIRLGDFIESLGVSVERSNRTVLDGLELDVVLVGQKIAFEFNGLYWHSSKFKETRYHLNKTDAAQKKGYRLIHIFEDEWTYRQEQTKAKIRSILGMDDRKKLYARKCSIGDVDKKTAKEFFDSNHIQGFASYTKAVGLYHGDELVACMTFRKRDDTEYELNRYATSKRVVGGFSKLLKHVVRELKSSGVEKIISFADKRYSDGNLYTANGWTHEYDTAPDYQYVMGDRRYRKQNFRRSVLGKKLKNFDPEKTEKQNMIENGFYPIYDCGLMKFSMQL